VGGVIIISLNLKNTSATYQEKRTIISRAGWLAGLALLLMYAGLILTGAFFQNEFSSDMNRTGLLTGIGLATLGKTTNLFLSILIGLACFTTAVGIVTGTADFMKSRFNNTNSAYRITALIACVLGVLMGQFDVGYIIAVALPALMFVYPITIILIFLNVLPERYTSKTVFRLVIFTTIIFSIPDFLNSLGLGNYLNSITNYIPLSGVSMGWVLPAVVVFLIANIISLNKK
jgi:LIVCS family branched-chain amino acid:cation transporter